MLFLYVYTEYLTEWVDEYSIALNYSSCKFDGKAMTNNNLTKVLSTPGSKNAVAQNVKYRIGGNLFNWTWKTSGGRLRSMISFQRTARLVGYGCLSATAKLNRNQSVTILASFQ